MPLAVIKDLFKIYFHEMEKLFPVESIFEELKQRGFHQPENQFQRFVVNINLQYAQKSFNYKEYLKMKKKMVSTSQATRFHKPE